MTRRSEQKRLIPIARRREVIHSSTQQDEIHEVDKVQKIALLITKLFSAMSGKTSRPVLGISPNFSK
jgi:hypothetical protein